MYILKHCDLLAIEQVALTEVMLRYVHSLLDALAKLFVLARRFIELRCLVTDPLVSPSLSLHDSHGTLDFLGVKTIDS